MSFMVKFNLKDVLLLVGDWNAKAVNCKKGNVVGTAL